MNLDELVRKNIKKLSAYEPGEQPTDGGWIKINTNENPYPPVPEILEDIKNAVNEKIKRYPDPSALEVRKAILNILLRDKDTLTNRNTVIIGNGCDEILDIIFKVFVDPGDEVVFFYPSYGMYTVLASQYDAKGIEIKLNEDFSIPESAYNAKSGTTMIVVTHEMGFARAVASEMIFIGEGVILERGTPQHFFISPKSERVKKFLEQLDILYGGHDKLLQHSNGEGSK